MSVVEDIIMSNHNISALPNVKEVISQRNKRFEKFIQNDLSVQAIYSKKYCVTWAARQYLFSHDIDIALFESCEGNSLQHAIHHEFITLTDTTAHLLIERGNLTEIKNLTTVIGNFIEAGTAFNHIGEVTKAVKLAEVGWAILDCIQAAGEGIVEGLYSVGYTITHPVETIENFSSVVMNCGYYCGLALKEIDVVADALINGDFEAAHNRYSLWSEHFKNIAQVFSDQCQDLAVRDVIKTLTRCAIESYATTRVINGFGSLFKHAHHSALHIAKKINNGMQESSLLISAEGIPVRIAQETLTQVKKLPRAQDKLLQVLSQFKGQKIKVGKITCLLDKRGLKHILERHHPKYWNGTLATTQTFLLTDTTVADIVKIIKHVIKQNRKSILERGVVDGQIDGIVKNITYRVGFKQGRIGQFYIPLQRKTGSF